MSKPSLIVTFLHSPLRNWGGWASLAVVMAIWGGQAPAQEAANNDAAELAYPLSVAVSGDDLYVVDLDLPGVWKAGAEPRALLVRGSNLLRKPMNRPRAIAIHPDGGLLVGDSATREVYAIGADGGEPKPLTDGYIGNVMAIAVSPDGKTVYVGDAEKRALFRFPIEGGKCDLVARVNARGLAFDSDGKLWAITPDDAAVQRVDVESKEVEKVITGRPFQYPNGLAWAGDHGYVTDGYGKCIWKFTADGKTEKWHEGDPLVGPVGIAVTEGSVFVADPKKKQLFEINRESKEVKERL